MPDQARFLDFMDMIDGGGKGQMGDKFEDGGIFSALANLVATPYGSEDAGRRARREAAYRAAGLLAPEEAEAAPAAAPAVTRTKPTREELMSARAAEMERQRGLEQDVFDPRGPNQMPAVTPVPASGYPNMSMPAIAGYTTPAAPMSDYPDMSMPSIAGYTAPAPAVAAPAYNPPQGYSTMPMGEAGRTMPTSDPEFDAFMARARNDAQFASIIDNPQTMRNIFNMYKQQRAAQAGM